MFMGVLIHSALLGTPTFVGVPFSKALIRAASAAAPGAVRNEIRGVEAVADALAPVSRGGSGGRYPRA